MSLSTEKPTEQKEKKQSRFQEDFESLRRVSLFNNLDFECLKLLAMICRRMDFFDGDELMVSGEDDGNAFLILTGKLHAFSSKDEPDNMIHEYGAGDFVGGCALLGRMPRVFTLLAMEKTTTLCLSREQFQKAIKQYPDGITRVSSNLATVLTKWDQHLVEKQRTGKVSDYSNLGVSLI